MIKVLWLLPVILLLWLDGCSTSQPEPKLLLQAPRTEVHPPSFEMMWRDGQTETKGDIRIVRSESRYSYDITPEKSGKKEGTAYRYDKASRKILSEVDYKNGLRDGWTRRYSPEGGWLYKATLYRQGARQKVEEYNQKGERVHITPYDSGGEKHGVEVRYSYTSGALRYRVNYDHGTAKRVVVYCKGKPSITMVLDGCRNGVEKAYHCGTTILKRETPYRSCKKNGVEKSYDEAGHLRYSVSYRDGLKEGPARVYYPDGRVEYALTYHHDRPDELGWHYDPSGKKERIDYDTLTHFAERFPKGFANWWQAL